MYFMLFIASLDYLWHKYIHICFLQSPGTISSTYILFFQVLIFLISKSYFFANYFSFHIIFSQVSPLFLHISGHTHEHIW